MHSSATAAFAHPNMAPVAAGAHAAHAPPCCAAVAAGHAATGRARATATVVMTAGE